MAEVTLVGEPRHAGRHAVRELRLTEQVPAVVYGPGVETRSVAINARELRRALHAAGSGLIALRIGAAEPVQVLAREVQRHPVKHYPLHVDFMAVAMNETLRLEVPVMLEGEAPIMSRNGIVMLHEMDMVEIECLPRDIPQHLVGNISKIETEHDNLFVRDLVVPPGVKVWSDPDKVVVSVTMSRTEAEAEATEAAEAAEEAPEVEVVAKGKAKEGEEEGEE
jgi:large subunit ribosomal protein L25